MAVTTTKLLQLRPIYHLPSTTTSIRSFASFSNSPDHPNQNSPQTNASTSPPPPQSSFSSYFSDVKSRLKQQQPHQSGIPKSQSKIRDLEEIRKNLSEFRLRSAGPTTSSQSPQQHLSFQDIYQRNVPSSGEQSSPSSSLTPGGGGGGSKSIGKQSLDSIRASLKQLRQTTPQQNQNQGPPGRINETPQHLSFQDIYQRNVPSSGEQSSPSSSLTPGGGGGGSKSIGKQSLDSIRASLKQLRQTTPQQNQNQGPPGRINETPQQHLSFQDIYQRNVPSSGEQSSPSSSLTPGGGGGGSKSIGKQSLDSIRASLKQLRQTTPQQNQNQGPPGTKI